jgi:hypothetical protein
MTVFSGEGLTYSFSVPTILFSSILLQFTNSFYDRVTFIIGVLVNDVLNKFCSLEVRLSSGLSPVFDCRNWKEHSISQSELSVALPRFEPGFTTVQFSLTFVDDQTYLVPDCTERSNTDLTDWVWDFRMVFKVTRRSKLEFGARI